MGTDDLEDWTQSAAPDATAQALPELEDWTVDKPPVKPRSATSPGYAVHSPDVAEGPAPAWPDTLKQGAKNLLPSTGRVISDIGSAIVHPAQTLGALKQFGTGAVSQIAGALGHQQDPQQKAKDEAVIDSLEDHYKQIYGPLFKGDTGNLRKVIATDPASVLMDASTFVTGGGTLAAKTAGEASLIGKAAKLAASTAQKADPVNLALQTAKKVGQAGTAIARGAQGMLSGVPSSVAKIATEAGADSDPAMRSVFLQYMHGQGNPAEFQQAAQDALKQVRQDASDKYLASKAGLSTAAPSYQPITDAIAEARSKIQRGGYNAGQFKDANAALTDAEGMVKRWFASPDPSYHTLEGFDNLKQAIWDKVDGTGNAAAQTALKGVYNGVKQAIIDVDPAYAKMMDQYQEGLKNLNDLTKSFGLGNNAAASTAMAKAFRQMRTEQGHNLFSQLAEKDRRLPYMVAGSALNPWLRGGHGNLVEGLVGLGLGVHNPATLPFSFAAQSPRVSGAANYALGAAGRTLAPAVSPAARYGAYQLGKAQNAPQEPAKHDAIFNKMLQQESGNKQTNPDGTPVVSKKGAVGAAQVMPQTGPEAAALAGEPWDAHKLVTDQDYNTRLGRAYFKAQAQKFGDPFIGAAAYNAGPNAVQRALELAKAKGGDYLAYLPPETQQYVARLMGHEFMGGRVMRASGGKVDDAVVEKLVRKLINSAKAAKKQTDATTKPLLNAPDETVVKALNIAQQSI